MNHTIRQSTTLSRRRTLVEIVAPDPARDYAVPAPTPHVNSYAMRHYPMPEAVSVRGGRRFPDALRRRSDNGLILAATVTAMVILWGLVIAGH